MTPVIKIFSLYLEKPCEFFDLINKRPPIKASRGYCINPIDTYIYNLFPAKFIQFLYQNDSWTPLQSPFKVTHVKELHYNR